MVIKMYKRIRDLREDKDLTQKTVSKYLHMSQDGYSQINRWKKLIRKKLKYFFALVFSFTIIIYKVKYFIFFNRTFS